MRDWTRYNNFDGEIWHYSSKETLKSLGVLVGNYIFSTVGSPEIQTAMTTELEQAAAFCCLLQQSDLDHAFHS